MRKTTTEPRKPKDPPFAVHEVTRLELMGGARRCLNRIFSEALEKAPNEQHFRVVIVPSSGSMANRLESLGLSEEIADENTRSATRDFDPYEAGRVEVTRLRKLEGGSWTGQELLCEFGLTPATLHRRRNEFRVLFWRNAKGDFHYPKWQFNPAGALLKGIEEVLQTFRSHDEWRVMRYFLSPRKQLEEMRPLDLIRSGKFELVLEHARLHAEENTW